MSQDGLHAHIILHRSAEFTLDVELAIPPGTTVALLGPNGAGKTTAVAALAGLIALDAGGIELDGVILDDPASGVFSWAGERHVGVVFQDYLLFPHLSVVENVAFGPRSRGANRADAIRMATGWLDRLGLGEFGQRRPGELSGGQGQRVALARALAAEPEVLLLDEPLSSLDVATRSELRHLLGEHLDAFPGPRVVVTHDPTEAFLFADRVYVIESGRITQSGTPDDIRLRPRTAFAADLAGVNLFTGRAREGVITAAGYTLHVVDDGLSGEVLATIHPHAISVHTEPLGGSPRNTWETTVEAVELLGDRARVRCSSPLPITAEVTRASVEELGLGPGRRVWLAVKATEIGVEPAG